MVENTKWKMPPKAKIYEALTALADGRVSLDGPGAARVTSSSGDKVYQVKWSLDWKVITSNDNASYWQGYLGYPIIAVLLKTGVIRYDDRIANRLRTVPWKQINDRFKRHYEKAVEYVLANIEGGDQAKLETVREVERIYESLSKLELERGRRISPPAEHDDDGRVSYQ